MNKFLTIIFLFFTYNFVFAQNAEELYKQGLKHRKEHNNKDGFFVFQKLLALDSNNVNYLSNASNFYSRYGFAYANEKDKISLYRTAEYLALKAIKKDDKNADCHYVYALALGRINENASSKQKIANSKLIKTELDVTLKLNPQHAGAYHILGRWHRTIAAFSAIEKLAINTLFGGVPEGGSYDAALQAFKQAYKFEPTYKLHQYELAQTYYEMKRYADAKIWATKALQIPSVYLEEKNTDINCNELLKKIKE